MSFSDFIFGSPGKMKPVPTMSPEQQAFFGKFLASLGIPMEQGMQYLSQMLSGSPESTAAFEAPIMREFNEKVIPGIAERFSGLGAGSQSSSAFQQSLGQAGAGLQETLSAQRAGLKNQALSQLMSMMNPAFNTQTFQYTNIPGKQGLFGGMAPFAGAAMGGGMGDWGMSLLKKLFGG